MTPLAVPGAALEGGLARFALTAEPPPRLESRLADVLAAARQARAAAAPAGTAELVAQALLADTDWFPAGSNRAAALVVPVAAGVVALAGPPGRELPALACGVEVAARVADAFAAAEHWDAAFAGAVTATALAGGRVLGLGADAAVAALGFAAGQSSGLALPAGSPARALVLRWAAGAGVEAALLARSGLTGPPAPLTGPRGLFAVHGLPDAAARMADGLGGHWAAGRLWTEDGGRA